MSIILYLSIDLLFFKLNTSFTGLEFFETSAKDNINVKAVFERLVDIICDKMSESLDSDPNMIPGGQQKGEVFGVMFSCGRSRVSLPK